MHRRALMVFAFALSGCMLGPDYQRPQTPLPTAYAEAPTVSAGTASTAMGTDWWRLYDDPILNDLVATAISENLDVVAAVARIEEFDADLREANEEIGLAPELIEGHDATRASDLYALGCVLYQCLAGRPPFEGRGPAEIGFALLVVVFAGRELSVEEDAQLHTMARSIVVKGVESPERLLNETALFLHRVITDLPPEKQHMLERLNSSDDDLIGRTALLVDDDPRNIFALSSALERRGMKVLTATTGAEAIEIIEETPSLAIVLMDIMMPEMDGYQTIERIRQDRAYRRLPIIALTAKAMKGDREKCLQAGASDYLAKPVNTEQLLSALRMWLHR